MMLGAIWIPRRVTKRPRHADLQAEPGTHFKRSIEAGGAPGGLPGPARRILHSLEVPYRHAIEREDALGIGALQHWNRRSEW